MKDKIFPLGKENLYSSVKRVVEECPSHEEQEEGGGSRRGECPTERLGTHLSRGRTERCANLD